MKSLGKKKLRTRVLHRSSKLKCLARSIGRLNYRSVARQAMKVPKIRAKVMVILAADIQKELTIMCAKKRKSILHGATPESVKSFSWGILLSELDTFAPTFTKVLRGIVQVKRRVRIANKGRKSWRPSEEAVVGVCAAIMLRNRNVHMNLLQRIVSLILHNGHASKQVR